jgi:hypothetical protein
MKLNLFARYGYGLGVRETNHLMILMSRGNGFRELWKTGIEFRDPNGYICPQYPVQQPGAFTHVYLSSPFKYGYKILEMGDNGGEINVNWVNMGFLASIPTVQSACNVNAESVHTWIIQVLDGETPNYFNREPAWSEDDYKTILTSK